MVKKDKWVKVYACLSIATATLAYIRESVPKNQKQKLIRRWVPKGGHPRAIFAVTNEGENPDCIIWKPGEPC